MAKPAAPIVRVRNWAWLMFVASGVENFFLQTYFWRFRPGAPDLQLGFLHKIKLANGIVFVSDPEFLAHIIFQAMAGLSFVLVIVATAISMGIEEAESGG